MWQKNNNMVLEELISRLILNRFKGRNTGNFFVLKVSHFTIILQDFLLYFTYYISSSSSSS